VNTAQRRGARAAGEKGRDSLAVRVQLLTRAIVRTSQRHAHELLGNESSETIKQLADPTFAKQHTG
jgi:hypothetical protein